MTQIKCLTVNSEDDFSWSEKELDKFVPIYFPKIVSLNARYFFLIGGSLNPDFTKPPKKEPENSIFLIDFMLQKVVLSKKMLKYRAHSACVVMQN